MTASPLKALKSGYRFMPVMTVYTGQRWNIQLFNIPTYMYQIIATVYQIKFKCRFRTKEAYIVN